MCNVYSFSGFAKILLKHNIQFSIRDFLNDEKVDLLIQQVVNKTFRTMIPVRLFRSESPE